jgi:hypothetical protein
VKDASPPKKRKRVPTLPIKQNNVKVNVNQATKKFAKLLRKNIQTHAPATSQPDIVDLDTLPDKPSRTDKWACGLSMEDEAIILNGDWLADNIIIAAQELIQKAYPRVAGFQNTNMGETLTFNVMKTEFVQILHTGHSHWVTVHATQADCTSGIVNVYDSLHPSLTIKLKKQIACLLFSDQNEITVNYRYCQFQVGSSDCGLFALAFASILAAQDDPSKYLFDQSAMRRHIHRCLLSGVFNPFPTKRIRRRISKKTVISFSVHCMCRMPEAPVEKMIQCNKCKEWYHCEICITVPKDVLEKPALPWYCNNCQLSS